MSRGAGTSGEARCRSLEPMSEAEPQPPGTGEPDADLDALPPPRRPWRRLTLGVMGVTLLASLGLLVAIGGELAFSFKSGSPRGLGELSRFRPSASDENAWVQGEAELEANG